METGLSTVATSSIKAKGSLAALSSSVAGLASTTKAFILAHPTTVGFVLGAGAVYSINRALSKKRQKKISVANAV